VIDSSIQNAATAHLHTARAQSSGGVAKRRGTILVVEDQEEVRNFVVQASAADWASVWLSGVRRDLVAVPGAELVFFQHDELIVHVPSANAPTVAEVTIAAA